MAFKDLLTCFAALLAAAGALIAVGVPILAGAAPPVPAVGGLVLGVSVIAVQSVVERRRRARRQLGFDP